MEGPDRPRDEVRVSIGSDLDIVAARQAGRDLADKMQFSSSDRTIIATAISELSRNIVRYAGQGVILIAPVMNGAQPGITITATDRGPGIRDVERAMQDGYSTSGSFGLGLPGVRRIMDEFDIVSQVGEGTAVTVRKWNTDRRP